MSNRCQYTNCFNRIIMYIGKCNSCNNCFCKIHRYSETHECPFLFNVKQTSTNLLIQKLKNESLSSTKINKI